MATTDRRSDRGVRRGLRALREFGDEVRDTRTSAGLSQAALARQAGLSQAQISRIERAELRRLSILHASVVATVLGLDLSVRTYPVGLGLRDAAHAERLRVLLQHVHAPLRYRTDVPLPQRPDALTELRAWDAMLYGHGSRTAIELELRIRDAQAITRRHAMKRRDDPTERFLLVLADTRTNRRIYAQYRDLWPELPRLGTSRVLAALEAGEHPASGIIFI